MKVFNELKILLLSYTIITFLTGCFQTKTEIYTGDIIDVLDGKSVDLKMNISFSINKEKFHKEKHKFKKAIESYYKIDGDIRLVEKDFIHAVEATVYIPLVKNMKDSSNHFFFYKVEKKSDDEMLIIPIFLRDRLDVFNKNISEIFRDPETGFSFYSLDPDEFKFEGSITNDLRDSFNVQFFSCYVNDQPIAIQETKKLGKRTSYDFIISDISRDQLVKKNNLQPVMILKRN
jgi:hypothetical protein